MSLSDIELFGEPVRADAVELLGKKFNWAELLEEALEVPGTIGTGYNSFHSYSFNNRLLLYMQGAREPVASYKRWQDVGRQVMKGSKGLVVVRPIVLKREDANGDESNFVRFKPVRGAFTYSQTEGEPLEFPESPEWDMDRALTQLDIERVPYTELVANSQGYSFERNVAISPVATDPNGTMAHEMAHIVAGHTAPEQITEYQTHRGRFEFEAEASSLLVTKEVGLSTPEQESESRGYIQNWLRGERPSDKSIRQVFKVADTIIKAGQVEVCEVTE